MKKIVTLIIFGFIAHVVFCHDSNYEKVLLRHWTIKDKGQKTIDGSFYMLKNDTVFIEAASGFITPIPFELLSKADQAFVLYKKESIDQLNHHVHVAEHMPTTQKPSANGWLLALFSLFLGLCFSSILYFDKKKLAYVVPFFTVAMGVMLFSFRTKNNSLILPPTNPLAVDAAFEPFKPNVHTFWDDNYFYVESKGIPTTHTMMVGISNHGWQQQVPIPQCYVGTNAWPIPLNPVFATNPIPVDNIHFTRGAIALAANGVPIFNVHTNTGVDSYLDGQLDSYGGHCGRADDYHYHIAPLHLYNHTATSLPIAYGLDGYAVYGSVEPDGSPMQALDINHGHMYNGDYHYHGTTSAPYMIAKMAGQVTEDATHQLIPQAAAHPVRPSLTPLNGALITHCTPNANNNGYNLVYTRNGVTDSIVYNWNNAGKYVFKFYTNGNLDSLKNYNGFVQCALPVSTTNLGNNTDSAYKVVIFPNPNQGVFQVELNSEIQVKDIKGMSIVNARGDVVFQTKHFSKEIEIKPLAKGTYYMRLQLTNKHLVEKFIID